MKWTCHNREVDSGVDLPSSVEEFIDNNTDLSFVEGSGDVEASCFQELEPVN